MMLKKRNRADRHTRGTSVYYNITSITTPSHVYYCDWIYGTYNRVQYIAARTIYRLYYIGRGPRYIYLHNIIVPTVACSVMPQNDDKHRGVRGVIIIVIITIS